MSNGGIKALLLAEDNDKVKANLTEVLESDLPDGDVTVQIDYSTLNYKDGMILKGIGRLVRHYPHIPGVDFSGVVENSSSDDFRPGDRVVLNGWRVGESRWGGYASKARVKSKWLVKLPKNISTEQAMGIGTAGYTAMLAIMALEKQGLSLDIEGEVLVTGAAGGVGSIAVSVLSNLGYNVAASTGREDTHEFLKSLGATSIIDRSELEETNKGPLGSERWLGAIDNVGGVILSNVLATMKYNGSCAAVGLAASHKLDTSVMPFLLRGVNLLGIDSVMCRMEQRLEAWRRLSTDLPLASLKEIVNVIPLSRITEFADEILAGQVRGRIVVDVNY